eukprot:gene38507-52021_t
MNPLGTPGNTAIQKYMNTKKVPQLFVSTGAAKWADPKNFPWTMGWQPSYQAEARIYAQYIMKNYPGKKVGVLYANDDFGKDYLIGLHDGFGDKAKDYIVSEVPYETSSPTVDSQIVQIKSANPDVFINIATPKFAAQAIKKVGEMGWKPIHIVTNVSASVGAVMKPAGYANSQDVLSAAYMKDPKDPTWKNDPGMMEWSAFMDKYYPEGDKEDGGTVFGYGVAQGIAQVLKQCGDDLTRENVLKHATNLEGYRAPVFLPGITYGFTPTDYTTVKALYVGTFNGTDWDLSDKPGENAMNKGYLASALRIAVISALPLAVTSAFAADKTYDPGATDTEIKIGQTIPHSGPGSLYGVLGRVGEAYFQSLNEKGGINGRKIKFLTMDDSYSAPKAVEATRRLVEQDEVLALYGSLGTAPQTAVHKYLNSKGVPQLLLNTGASKWNDPKNNKWTMAGLPLYPTEARIL